MKLSSAKKTRQLVVDKFMKLSSAKKTRQLVVDKFIKLVGIKELTDMEELCCV